MEKKNGSFHKNTSVSSPNRIFTVHFFRDFVFSSETLRTNVFNFTQNSFLHWNLTEILTLTIHWIWLFWIQLLFLYCKIRARAFEWFQKLVFHQKVLNLNFHWKKIKFQKPFLRNLRLITFTSLIRTAGRGVL